MSGQRKELVGAAIVAAAATGAAANTDGHDILVGVDTWLERPMSSDAPSLDVTPDQLVGFIAPHSPGHFTGDAYLVAEQHDGTWVGGVGKDVVSPTTKGSPRRLRDRLNLGGVAGGATLAGGILLAAWAFFRRRRP